MTDLPDLTRHAVIEASAGTGKTHALQQIILSLLDRQAATLDQILVVTFTEKATGELKGRLRQALEEIVADRGPLFESVHQNALDTFDQASIFTMHGFCKRILDEFALENGQDPSAELVNDIDLLELGLREIQRRDWWRDYGDRLAAILELSTFNTASRRAQRWEQVVLQVAGRFRPRAGQVLFPATHDEWHDDLRKKEEELATLLQSWRPIIGDIDRDRVTEHPWYRGFDRLPVGARIRIPRRNEILFPLLAWLADPRTPDRPVASLLNLVKACDIGSFKTNGFRALTAGLAKKAQDPLDDECPGLRSLVEDLEEYRATIDGSRFGQQLTLRTIHQLQGFLHEYKREHGLQSFEDMLTRLHDALDPKLNPQAKTLRTLLRQRYRYAVVDEFQDTDPIQWRIFHRLFVEGAEDQRLVIVGDPKQAIYGFRGADLETFLTASRQLVQDHGAQEHDLTTNWRTCSQLIDSLNHLFEKGQWFGGNGLRYVRVTPPEKLRYELTTDRSKRGAFNMVELRDAETLVTARRTYADFVVREIQRFLSVPIEYRTKDKIQPLQAGDIAVLVIRRSEAIPIVDRLRAAKIPFVFYKQPGLWQSDEAVHLLYVLKAIAQPADRAARCKALLTRFFRRRPEEIANADDTGSRHPAQILLLDWARLAEQRRWAELFQSILEDSGILFAEFEGVDPDRSLANLKHIVQTLQHAAYDRDLDLLGVVEELDRLSRNEVQEDSNVQPIESERPKVKIMTIHAAKGLEFPIVFLAGGFTQRRPDNYLVYRDSERNLVIDLRTDDATAKQLAQVEFLDEQRRLLYVALTRAIFKAYVPHLDKDKRIGSPGPLVTLLAAALDRAGAEECGDTIDPNVAMPVPRRSPRSVPAVPRETIVPVEPLFPILDPTLSQRRIVTRSFSSLHRALAAAEGPHYHAERPARGDDDPNSPLARPDELRGPIIGDMVHDILERIDFEEAGRALQPDGLLVDGTNSRTLFDRIIGRHAPRMLSRLPADELPQQARTQVARMVWCALHTPLPDLGCLHAIPACDRLAELEFNFPEIVGSHDLPAEEGFFTGFMDLVVRRGDLFYLIDWKTNSLPDYADADVAQCMRQSDYIRQYRLYLCALSRWLSRRGRLAGVYYLFVRGMTGRADSPGVYFHQPSADDLLLERVTEAVT